MNEGASLSRATSLSRASRPGSSLSRNQSLIKKAVAPPINDLKPSDILIERFVAWKAIVKQLIAYFEGIADIHNSNAKELTKLGAVIQVPFRAGNQFLGEGGLQDIYYDVRDKTRAIADQHANLGRTIDSSIVQHLEKLRTEIKAHLKNIQNDTGKLASNVARERELSTRLISELSSGISSFKNTPMAVTNKTDPFVINQAVVRQLTKQVHEENLLQKSIIIMQQNSAHFEEGIVRAIQSAWQTYDEWQARMAASIGSTHSELTTHMASLAPDREWLAFSGRTDHLLDPETPLRNPATIMYPSKDDPSVAPVHAGLLERKKRYTRAYKEHYFVLTPAGFLHEYASSDPVNSREPLFSLFLPMCTLGPPSGNNAKSHKFHIEGRKDGSGTTKSGSVRRTLSISRLSGSDHAWSFRARSREEMMEWWNDIRMLCARYLVASEQMERSGPVAAAVRAAGYLSEDEDGSEEGSSVEEDEEDGLEYVDADGEPPSYSMPHSALVTGANGYPLDKKNGHSRHASTATNAEGATVSRRPSKRQQEKAPEGREPHVVPAGDEAEEATMPGGESRFKENV
ncbi:PH domain-containing protein [Mycena chlorophos]|uniref:PH domain-containing protein n=1 Tax=Mycena chlorophos TaxID=658473 RepID=A0A8H6W2B4_MYCCL|nr:PH domain-containing protein [Mycena chlorophos]